METHNAIRLAWYRLPSLLRFVLRRLAVGVLLERPGEAGGNFVDAHSQLGGHGIDRRCATR